MMTLTEELFLQLTKTIVGEPIATIFLDLRSIVAYLQAVKSQDVNYKDWQLTFFAVSRNPPLVKIIYKGPGVPRNTRVYLLPCYKCKKPILRQGLSSFSIKAISKKFICTKCKKKNRLRLQRKHYLLHKDECAARQRRRRAEIRQERKTIEIPRILTADIFTAEWYQRMTLLEFKVSKGALFQRMFFEMQIRSWEVLPMWWVVLFHYHHVNKKTALALQYHQLKYKMHIFQFVTKTDPLPYRGKEGLQRFLTDFQEGGKRWIDYEFYLAQKKAKESFRRMHSYLKTLVHSIQTAKWEYKTYLMWPRNIKSRNSHKTMYHYLSNYLKYRQVKGTGISRSRFRFAKNNLKESKVDECI